MANKTLTYFLIFFIFSCCHNTSYLEVHFQELHRMSPPKLIEEFKQMPFDSAIIHNERFNEIFVKNAKVILSDSAKAYALSEYFKNNNIQLLGRQDKWTVIAAFHKYLNNEKYDILELWEAMSKLSNKEYEKQYPKPQKIN